MQLRKKIGYYTLYCLIRKSTSIQHTKKNTNLRASEIIEEKNPPQLAIEKESLVWFVMSIHEINGVDALSVAEFLNQKNPLKIIFKYFSFQFFRNAKQQFPIIQIVYYIFR